jgi:hypothetical protein
MAFILRLFFVGLRIKLTRPSGGRSLHYEKHSIGGRIQSFKNDFKNTLKANHSRIKSADTQNLQILEPNVVTVEVVVGQKNWI